MADESAEIFDDLYLGLRAGGALRKQRRGEPLTPEEQERLAESFEKLEIEKMGAGTHQRLHAKMERLVAELAVR